MSIFFRPHFYFDCTYVMPNNYLCSHSQNLFTKAEVIEAIKEYFSRGDVTFLNIDFYPAGKMIIDQCECLNIPYRQSVAPTGQMWCHPGWMDDVIERVNFLFN